MKKTLFLILSVIITALSYAQPYNIAGKTTKDTFFIGERIPYSFSVPVNDRLTSGTSSPNGDSLILQSHRTDTVGNNIKYSYVYTSFTQGNIPLPEFVVSSQNGEYSVTAPVITIISPVIDTVNIAVKPLKQNIKVPVTFNEIKPLLFIATATAILIVATVLLVKKLRKRKVFVPNIEKKVDIAEDIEAINNLKLLKNAHFIEQNRIKDHYTALTDILWKYIFRRWGINAFEMTTAQILSQLDTTDIDFENTKKLKYVFDTADLVKFAKYNPDIRINTITMDDSISFIENTKRTVGQNENINTANNE